ncbi:MAG: hypothetical protein L0207_01615 [Chlamydiae bacterium]|nr:hypothetical protein [Chlamydiota bacterium]
MLDKSTYSKILLREWIAIALILGFMVSFFLITFIDKINLKEEVNAIRAKTSPIFFEVEVEGAVQRPGKYQIVPGTSLKSLLKDCGLLAKADRKKINFKKIFYNAETIHIPEKTKVKK